MPIQQGTHTQHLSSHQADTAAGGVNAMRKSKVGLGGQRVETVGGVTLHKGWLGKVSEQNTTAVLTTQPSGHFWEGRAGQRMEE